MRRGLPAACAALLLAGCVYVHPYAPEARTPAPVDLRLFDYAPADAPPRTQAEDVPGVASARRIVFPAAPGASFPETTAHAWTPAPGAAPRASVLLFPILGGDYGLQEFLARWLATEGYATLWFERPRDPVDPALGLPGVRAYLIDAVREARRALDWWTWEPGVDPARVSALGTSMGSLVATLLLAAEPRLEAGALLLGGSDVARILAEAEEVEIARLRAASAERGLAGDAFLAEARRTLADAEPLRYAPALDPAKVLLVVGRFDAVVPYETATALWEAAGRPERLVFWGGHYSAIPYLRDIQKAVLAHFDRRLGAVRKQP